MEENLMEFPQDLPQNCDIGGDPCNPLHIIQDPAAPLQGLVDKLTENQSFMLGKFDYLNRSVQELRLTMDQFSHKIISLEELATDKKKVTHEIKLLKTRIDELYAIVKEGKEDESVKSDVQEVESCHSGVSCSSKVPCNSVDCRCTLWYC